MRIDRAVDGSKVQRGSKDEKNTVSLFHTVKINTLCKTILHIYSILLCVLGLNNAEIFKRIKDIRGIIQHHSVGTEDGRLFG
jgi:hypothetical protein